MLKTFDRKRKIKLSSFISFDITAHFAAAINGNKAGITDSRHTDKASFAAKETYDGIKRNNTIIIKDILSPFNIYSFREPNLHIILTVINVKRKKRKKSKLLTALEIPEEIAAGAVKVTVTGFNTVRIDNYKSLVEYENDVIRINTGDKLVKIAGEKLDILSLTDDTAEISGDITGVEFE